MKKIALLLYTVIVLVLAANCDRRAEYLTASGAMLGTTFQATGDITDCTAQELYRAIMQIDAEAKASMSIFDSTSLLSRINRGETDSLDEHIIYNLRLAERFSRLSEGHYDVTVKPLVDAWGFAGHEAERTPNLDSLLQFVGYRRVHIRDGRLVKDDPRVQLDFNSPRAIRSIWSRPSWSAAARRTIWWRSAANAAARVSAAKAFPGGSA